MEGFLGGFLFGNVDEEGLLENDDFDKELQEGLRSFVKSAKATGFLDLDLVNEEGGPPAAKEAGRAVEARPVPSKPVITAESMRQSRLARMLFAGRSQQVRFTNLFRSGELLAEDWHGGEDARLGARFYRLRRCKIRRRKHARPVVLTEDQREVFRRRSGPARLELLGRGGASGSPSAAASEGLMKAIMMRTASAAATSASPSASSALLPGLLGAGSAGKFRILAQLRALSSSIRKPGAAGPRGTRGLDAVFRRYAAAPRAAATSLTRREALARVCFVDCQFHPILTTAWEEGIVYGDGDDARPAWQNERLGQLFVEVRSLPPPKPAGPRPISPFAGNPLLGLASAMASLPSSRPPSRPPSGYSTPPLYTPTRLQAGSGHNLLRRPRSEATRVTNHDLDTGDWLQAIIWDECEAPPVLPPTRLLLNLNDPLLLVDVEEPAASGPAGGLSIKDLSRLNKLINKAKAKKGMNGPLQQANAQQQPAGLKPLNYAKPQSGERFNLSNDKYYEAAADHGAADQVSKATQQTLVKSQLAARIGLQHSVPALKLITPFFQTAWSKPHMRAWHRPALQRPIEPAWTFSAVREKARTAGHVVAQVLRNAKKIGLRDGAEYAVLEYSEEFPLLMTNAGMATFIQTVYRRTGPKDPIPPLAPPYGSLKILEAADPSPFWLFGDIPPGRLMPVIQNNLFRAPLFEHDPPPTDFLAIRSHVKGKAGSRLFLRPLPAKLLLAGQLFPTAQIFGPHSRKHNNYCRARIQVFAYRLFAKDLAAAQAGIAPRLKIARILAAFPLFSEGSVRKWLKEYGESIRGGKDTGVWERKADAPVLSEDDLRALVTPEMVCLYEAMLAGQQRLSDAGFASPVADDDGAVRHLADPSGAYDDMLDTDGTGEVLLAPWNLTANFANAIIGKSALQVRGPGDPSGGRGEAFSFVKMPSRMASNKLLDSSQDAVPEASAGQKRARPLTDQQAYKAEIARIWHAQLTALSSPVPPTAEDDQHLASMGGEAAASAAHKPSSLLQETAEVWKDIHRTIRQGTRDDDELDELGSVTSKATSANQTNLTSTTAVGSSHAAVTRRLVITRTRRQEDGGGVVVESETITDPYVIQAYLKERKAFDVKHRRKIQLATANALKAANRPAKAPKPPKAPRPSKAPSAPPKPKKVVMVRCGTCGEIGHMRTNRVCPMYSEYEREMASSGGKLLEEGDVRVEGTKISISKLTLERISTTSSSSVNVTVLPTGTPVPATKPKKSSSSASVGSSRPAPIMTMGQQRGVSQLSLLLQDILTNLVAMTNTWPFRRPVSKKDYPHYYLLIAKPIDLQTIRSRARRQVYRTAEAFLADVRLLRDNCVRFNGDDHPFSAMARELVEEAEHQVSSRQDQIQSYVKDIAGSQQQQQLMAPESPLGSLMDGESIDVEQEEGEEDDEEGKEELVATFDDNDDVEEGEEAEGDRDDGNVIEI